MDAIKMEPEGIMRAMLSVCLVIVATACGRTDSAAVTMHKGRVERVGDCHVLLDNALASEGTRRAFLRTSCGAPESALKEKQSWGNRPEPMLFSVDVGDCMLLEATYHCLEDVDNGATATFRAAYKRSDHSGTVIEKIK